MSKSSLITKGLEKCLSGPHVLHRGRPVFCLQKQLRENMCQFFFLKYPNLWKKFMV